MVALLTHERLLIHTPPLRTEPRIQMAQSALVDTIRDREMGVIFLSNPAPVGLVNDYLWVNIVSGNVLR